MLTSGNRAGSWPFQAFFIKLQLTEKLTGTLVENRGFSWTTVEKQKRLKPLLTCLETPVLVHQVPVGRFEPPTLAGLVFETSAYTVPPHRPAGI